MVKNFDEIESLSSNITALNIDQVEVLMNSALYYQKKY